MSTEIITALCTGIVTIIAAVGALLVSLRTNKAVREDTEAKGEQLDEIHVLVNSRLSEVTGQLAQASLEITELKKQITGLLSNEKIMLDTIKEDRKA